MSFILNRLIKASNGISSSAGGYNISDITEFCRCVDKINNTKYIDRINGKKRSDIDIIITEILKNKKLYLKCIVDTEEPKTVIKSEEKDLSKLLPSVPKTIPTIKYTSATDEIADLDDTIKVFTETLMTYIKSLKTKTKYIDKVASDVCKFLKSKHESGRSVFEVYRGKMDKFMELCTIINNKYYTDRLSSVALTHRMLINLVKPDDCDFTRGGGKDNLPQIFDTLESIHTKQLLDDLEVPMSNITLKGEKSKVVERKPIAYLAK